MFEGLNHLHSALRYVVVLMLVLTIINSFAGWFSKKAFRSGDRKLGLFAMVFCHIQLVVGLILYVISPTVQLARGNISTAMQDPVQRFFLVEHIAMMILGIALVTIGYSTTKRAKTDEAKHKRTAIFYLLGFLVIFFSIPWPFLKSWSTSWF